MAHLWDDRVPPHARLEPGEGIAFTHPETGETITVLPAGLRGQTHLAEHARARMLRSQEREDRGD